jgi:hypothetical protein
MKKFKYIGLHAHNSTILIESEGRKVKQDIRLAPGDEAMLPEDHEVICALIGRGLLEEIKISITKQTDK